MSSSNSLPLSNLGPTWSGVQVLVTETGFTTENECSKGYGFNLGTHVDDFLPDVLKRRALLESYVGAELVWLNQVHGCNVHRVDDPEASGDPPEADAAWTGTPQHALVIMTADCLPVVFAAFDSSGRAVGVAAAHAGWRGLHAGVLQATATELAGQCGVPVRQVKAWMGPAIGPNSFEVGQEVFDSFVQECQEDSTCFVEGQLPGKHLADLYGLATSALRRSGILHVEGGGHDTFTDLRWFSHRRGQQQVCPSGRFATVIRLLP